MKNHIENTCYLAKLKVCSRIWRVLDRLPHSSEKELETSFLNRLHWNGAYTQGYTCKADSGRVRYYSGRFGCGFYLDKTFSTRYSWRIYFYVSFKMSDFIRPLLTRRDILAFVRDAEAVGKTYIPRDVLGNVELGYLLPSTRAYIAQKWDFGDNSFNLLFREQVLQYVVDDEALDAFCASLSSSLGLPD